MHQLKEQPTDQVLSADRLARVESYQHPDHDTNAWPAETSAGPKGATR